MTRFVDLIAEKYNLSAVEWSGNNDDLKIWVDFAPDITEEQGEEIEELWEKMK